MQPLQKESIDVAGNLIPVANFFLYNFTKLLTIKVAKSLTLKVNITALLSHC